MSSSTGFSRLKYTAAILAGLSMASPGSAELVISQLVVELTAKSRTSDVLIFNNSSERSYVSIEPREILAPGTAAEKKTFNPDPRVMGLLLSSMRLVLEPQQKRLVRLAATSIPADKERVYRVTIKPVTGGIETSASGLKLLVGYEMLVMVKPAVATPVMIGAQRSQQQLTLINNGKSSVELLDGKQCRQTSCTSLPSKRLYAGAHWSQEINAGSRIEYRAVSSGMMQSLTF